MGLTTALSPQIDLSTEPRWRRFYGSFSESPELSRDMAQTYCDAFQTTKGSKNGWGDESVNCMVKHWPGGGSGEGGRDAHFGIGIMGSALKLRTPPKYAALRLAWEAYYFSCLCFQNCFAKVKPFFEKCNLFQIYFHKGCLSQPLGNPI